MQRIALIMQRKTVAQRLTERLQEEITGTIGFTSDYDEAVALVAGQQTDVALVEVTEGTAGGSYNVGYCLGLCDVVRKQKPDCKLLLLCPEEDSESVRQAVQAKLGGRIDDFVFYETTIDYLIAKLMSFCMDDSSMIHR